MRECDLARQERVVAGYVGRWVVAAGFELDLHLGTIASDEPGEPDLHGAGEFHVSRGAG